jgi:hypothetical protein
LCLDADPQFRLRLRSPPLWAIFASRLRRLKYRQPGNAWRWRKVPESRLFMMFRSSIKMNTFAQDGKKENPRRNSLKRHGSGKILGVPRRHCSALRNFCLARNDRTQAPTGVCSQWQKGKLSRKFPEAAWFGGGPRGSSSAIVPRCGTSASLGMTELKRLRGFAHNGKKGNSRRNSLKRHGSGKVLGVPRRHCSALRNFCLARNDRM